MQARTLNTLAIGLATVLLSPLALAQSQQSTTSPQDTSTTSTSQNATARQPMTPLNSDMSISTFHHLDTNHDGHVTLAEARADSSFNSRFAAMDSDGNGYISQDELKGEKASAAGSSASGTTYGNADESNYESGTSTTTTTESTQDSDTNNPPKDDQDSDDDKSKSP